MTDLSIQKLNLNNPEHSTFFYKLAMACKDEFFDDFHTDVIQQLAYYNRQISSGATVAFLISDNTEHIGIVWVDISSDKIGYLHAGLLPEHRKGFTAYKCLRLFVNFCFKTLDLRSLEAQIPVYNKVAEKLLRRFGFTKYGIRPEAILVSGKPESHVLLWLSRDKHKGLING